MPTIDIVGSGFKGPLAWVNGLRGLDVSRERLINTAMTLGGQYVKRGAGTSHHAVTMAAYRALAIKAAIDFSGTALVPRPEYVNLDTTEKANLSFWTGMTFAALLAHELLGVPVVYHVRAQVKAGVAVANAGSRSLPDLVGQDGNGNWHVLEAKARQRTPTPKDRARWKQQANQVAAVNGRTPASASYSMARVAPTYSVELVDPEGEEPDISISIGEDDDERSLREAYYGIFLDATRASQTRIELAGERLRATRVAYDLQDNRFVFLGVSETLFERFEATDEPPERRGVADYKTVDRDNFHLGDDGIAIITSAEPEL